MGSSTVRRAAVAVLGVATMVLAAAVACSSGSQSTGGDESRVARVVDGDTLVIDDGTRVRLIGIDTPETVDPRRPVECFGREASDHLKDLLPPGTAVRLEYDVERTDRYGRTLAYVRRADDDLFVNVSLARDGYAVQLTVPPNIRYVDDLTDAVDEARDNRRGLWADGACTAP